jgi:uncharacterized damage-inducible protein DinB
MPSPPNISRIAAALAAAAVLMPLPATAQQDAMPTSGLRAELIHDIDELEEKYMGLADAMTGKYDWRPGEGVRSVGEVFMHIAGANMFLPTMAGVEPPEALQGLEGGEVFERLGAMEEETDEATIKQALRDGFAHAKAALAAVPDSELDAATNVFGNEATKRVALTLLVTHMHEHLGQSIAYARTNGVVPPWSAGGGG